MRLLITFLVTLFLPSLMGNKAVFGSISSARNHHSAVQELVISKIFERTVEKQVKLVANPEGLFHQEDEPIFLEDSRDDEPVKKTRFILAALSVFIYPFLASQVHTEEISPPYFPDYSPAAISAKYIAQRVLRI